MNTNPNDPRNPGDEPGSRAETIFDRAAELPRHERDDYVRQASGGDVELQRQVEALLRAHDEAGNFLEDPAATPAAKTIVLSLPLTEKPGDRIGRYKLLQQVGEGGCGVVYMAEQEEPVRRRVALKVIKLGMDTRSVIARFEAERQALAMMDHPNIAKVLDAGATDTGRPFFVMELVRGIRITDYCDQNKLSTNERLKLFVQVCHAIQHAHQKGIIHRDIKPSNILVTLHDGVAVPKVIDFGIAKATQGRLTDQTLFTAFEQFIGTPAYMSPEQAEMSGLDIDTRSDIYALGVLLYELLTGRTPFDAKDLLMAGLDGLRRIIREQEPERPSTRLGTLVRSDLTAVAHLRREEPPRLLHMLRHDLDWIVMKALEKDRTRRYETTNGFATDIERYMRNEPVTARPPGTLYRFQKLVRRNRATVAAAGTGLAALIIGLALSLYMFTQERAARQRAVAAEREQARMRQQAEQDAVWGQKLAEAGMLVSRGRFSEAEASINEIPPYPTLSPFYSVFGLMNARYANWTGASNNYSRVVEFLPGDIEGQIAFATILARLRRDVEHDAFSRAMLRRFEHVTDSKLAQQLATSSLLLARPREELDFIGRFVDIAFMGATPGREAASMHLARGLLEFRRGNYIAAETSLRAAQNAPEGDRFISIHGELLMAITEFRIGKVAEARERLAKAIAGVNTRLPKPGTEDIGSRWMTFAGVEIAMQEALSLMPAETNSVGGGLADWRMKLRQAGIQFNETELDDNTVALHLDDQPITDLEIIRGAPVRRLSIMRTGATNLAPLRGMPLRVLRLAATPVTDLGPLEGMKLESLQISGTKVSDLTPLRGMPLRDLRMTDCRSITNVDVLAEMHTLQTLILPPNARDYEFLRSMTNLGHISFQYDSETKGPGHTAAEFWADHDRQKSGTNLR